MNSFSPYDLATAIAGRARHCLSVRFLRSLAHPHTLLSASGPVRSAGSGVRVEFEARPAVVNGEVQRRERGALALPGQGAASPLTPDCIRDDVAGRYQAAVDAWEARRND